MHLWTLKFELHIVFICVKILFFWPFSPLKNAKTILSLQAIWKQAEGWIGPVNSSLPTSGLQPLTTRTAASSLKPMSSFLRGSWSPGRCKDWPGSQPIHGRRGGKHQTSGKANWKGKGVKECPSWVQLTRTGSGCLKPDVSQEPNY